MVGRTISHYKIVEQLGAGGMGVVYRAEDTRLKRIVALKFLPLSFSSDRDAEERFIHEAQAASALQHNNICVIHDIDETPDGQTFICMEFYEGESLKSKIERGPLRIDDAVETTSQVAQGLAKAHEHGIVHRDIKPANILVTADGSAKILDFGLAKMPGRTVVTREGTTLGTVCYMSPEQVRAESVDRRTDLWSLGVVFYEMLTGRLPFRGDYDNAVFYGITNADPEPPTGVRTGIPPELERIVLKMLAKDPKERYQHADELLADLRRYRRQSEPSIVLPPRPVPAPAVKRRRTRVLGFAGALIIALAVAFLVFRPFLESDLLASNPVPVTVISFVNQTGDHAYDYLQDAIPNLLITNLEQSKYLRVTTWERLHDLLEQMGRKDVAMIDRDLGFELCRRDGINAIVLGSYVKAGNVFATDVKVLDVRTKNLLKSASAQGEGIESILKSQIDELSREISRGVGLTERTVDATPLRIQEHSTSSMEAYNYYLRGVSDLNKFYYPDAIRFLQRSVSIDSNFAAAHLAIGQVYRRMGNMNQAVESMKKAKSLVNRATRKESIIIEGIYATSVDHDVPKGLRLALLLIEEFPKEKDGYFYEGMCQSLQNAHDDAIGSFRKVLELDPNDGEALNQLGYLYAQKGDFPKAIEYLKRYAAINPGDANPFDSMGEIYMRMGNLDEAQAKYREALEARPDFVMSYMGLAYVACLREEYQDALRSVNDYLERAESPGVKADGLCARGLVHFTSGQYHQANDVFREDELLAEQLGNSDLQAMCIWARGWISLVTGSPEESGSLLSQWYAISLASNPNRIPELRVRYCAAQAFRQLLLNKPDSARAKLTELRTFLPGVAESDRRASQRVCDLLQAEIWLSGDSAEAAIELFRSMPVPPVPTLLTTGVGYYNIPNISDGLARAYLKAGRIEDAINEYERLSTPGSRGPDRTIIPAPYHYRLAKLYEQSAQKAKAIACYRKFLSVWKNADRNLPELIDAKKRLTGLGESV